SLDDSAARRLVLPQTFLAIDAALNLYLNIVPGLVVHPRVIARHVAEHLPAMATENLLMAAVQAGGDRQALPERIRRHALAAATRVHDEGGENDLLDRLQADPAFAGVDLASVINPERFVGLAPQQVASFLEEVVEPIRRRYPMQRAQRREVHV